MLLSSGANLTGGMGQGPGREVQPSQLEEHEEVLLRALEMAQWVEGEWAPMRVHVVYRHICSHMWHSKLTL